MDDKSWNGYLVLGFINSGVISGCYGEFVSQGSCWKFKKALDGAFCEAHHCIDIGVAW